MCVCVFVCACMCVCVRVYCDNSLLLGNHLWEMAQGRRRISDESWHSTRGIRRFIALPLSWTNFIVKWMEEILYHQKDG